MKRMFAFVLEAFGIILVIYFSYVFVIFNSTDNPALIPFAGEPILFSIGFIVLGVILLSVGLCWHRRLKKESTVSGN